MRFMIPKLEISPENFLRQCGYLKIANPHKSGEISYARSLDPGRFYPRFHIYIEINPENILINLHLDAKKPSYEGVAAHSGEYDSPLVTQESERVKNISEKFLLKNIEKPLGFKNKKSWLQNLFS